MNASPLPWLAITPGEPAGIGPDLVVRWLHAHGERPGDFRPVVIADPELLRERAARLGITPQFQLLDKTAMPADQPHATNPAILPIPLACPAVAGRLDPDNAGYVLDTLAAACDGCLSGRFAALVTGPVHKGVINDAGIPFTGHTEFLAERCQAEPVMMLTAPGLRVALVTTHLALAKVSPAITPDHLQRVIEILHRDLSKRFGIAKPRILVCGLNPHAGEGGHLGDEEQTVIMPVLERLRARGWKLTGPLPADTAFVPRQLEQTDAVLAMYHDQGLPVLKHLGFGQAVNVTLGLPMIRTSVDHGTALNLAGTDQADLGSLQSALATALEMVGNHSY